MNNPDVKVEFVAMLVEKLPTNEFVDLPVDIIQLLHNPEGTLGPIVENLIPGQRYTIQIRISSTNQQPTQ